MAETFRSGGKASGLVDGGFAGEGGQGRDFARTRIGREPAELDFFSVFAAHGLGWPFLVAGSIQHQHGTDVDVPHSVHA